MVAVAPLVVGAVGCPVGRMVEGLMEVVCRDLSLVDVFVSIRFISAERTAVAAGGVDVNFDVTVAVVGCLVVLVDDAVKADVITTACGAACVVLLSRVVNSWLLRVFGVSGLQTVDRLSVISVDIEDVGCSGVVTVSFNVVEDVLLRFGRAEEKKKKGC